MTSVRPMSHSPSLRASMLIHDGGSASNNVVAIGGKENVGLMGGGGASGKLT